MPYAPAFMRNAPPTVPGDADQPFHSTKIVFGAKGYGAAKVRCGVHDGNVAFEHDFLFRLGKLQHYEWQFSVDDEKVRASTQEFVWDAVAVQQIQQIRDGIVAIDAYEVGGAADTEIGHLRKRGSVHDFVA